MRCEKCLTKIVVEKHHSEEECKNQSLINKNNWKKSINFEMRCIGCGTLAWDHEEACPMRSE